MVLPKVIIEETKIKFYIILMSKSHKEILKNFNKIYKDKCSNYPAYPSILPAVNRIIVIGDIHGDMKMLIKCLKLAKLIDHNYNWIGNDTVVVQVGDQIDSCRFNGTDACNDPDTYTPENDNPEDIDILYFMTDLHNKASQYGGAIYSLMGNHEFMNVMGDFTYVSHNNINHFNNYKTHDGTIINDGVQARKYAFSPGNHLAHFLACTRKMALMIGSNLFVHAGVIPQMVKKYKIDDMNKILILFLLDQLKNPNIFTDLFISGKTSPLWTRLFGFRIDNCVEVIQPLKDIYNVNKIYVGHTPQIKSGINSQCNNSVWMTDVGMSKAFDLLSGSSSHRNAQVLEILNDGEIFNILQ
jgi:hypothetical protein